MDDKKGVIRELNADDFAIHDVKRGPSFRSLESKEQYETARSAAAAKRQAVSEPPREEAAETKRAKKKRRIDLSEMDTSFLHPAKDESMKVGKDDFAFPINLTVLGCVALLSLFGVVMVASSSYYYAYTYMGDSLYFLGKQIMWLLIGGIVLIVAAIFPMKWIKRLSLVIYALSVFFCVAVLFFGETVNGSTRWLNIAGISFQPAEFAKLGVAIYVAVLVEQYQTKIKKPGMFLALFSVTIIPAILVGIENLTSALIIAVIGFAIMFVGGCRFKGFFLFVFPVALLILAALVAPIILSRVYGDEWASVLPGFLQKLFNFFMYRTDRISSWINPWKEATGGGYQTVQALYAVGSGGFFGRGLGNSLQKLGFIPEAHNDIIFAVICEELGVFGAAIVIVLFSILVFEGIKIAANAQDRFAGYVTAGITAQIGLQAILNMAVNLNLVPTTGVSLPFISYGGTSLVFLMASVGLMLNASRRAPGR